MKSFFAMLLAVMLLAAVAVAGVLVYNRVRQPVQPTAVPPVSQSTSPKTPDSLIKDPNNPLQQELVDSTADMDKLSKLIYEIGKNPDTVAWLTVPGTDIDNSVVQSHNNSYYLRRDERGKENIYGCYFADYECFLGNRETLSQNTVIYGHSDLKDNPDGPKFSQLFRYADPAFAKENKVISLTVPETTLRFEVFAVFYTDVDFNYIRTQMSEEDFAAMIKQAQSYSLHQMETQPTAQDKILTLSTCGVKHRSDGNGRFVVMARLLEP